MGTLFDPDSKIMVFISRFTDLTVLNLVFLLTCIPVFTVGAASTALYAAVLQMDTEREGKLLSTYFRAFRENFRQSTIIWALIVLFAAASYFNMAQFAAMGGILGKILYFAAVFVFAILVLLFGYAFPLLSQFDNTVLETVKNALLLAVAHLPQSLALTAVNCFPCILMLMNLYAFLKLGFLWTFLYFAATAYWNSRLLRKIFAPYREAAEAAGNANL